MGLHNPFRTYKLEDFPDVYIPLSQATRHPSVVAENRRRSSVAVTLNGDEPIATRPTPTAAVAVEDEKNHGAIAPSNPSRHSSEVVSTSGDIKAKEPLTVDKLRAEIEADIVASGHDSAYDRKAKVINKAIQDIGMGRYQWELFILCGL